MTFPVPRRLHDAALCDGRGWWLDELPAIAESVRRRWDLRIDGPFEPGGQTAWVAPATAATGQSLVVKIAWPHPEAEHEAHGLQVWNGQGAVQLHDVEQHDHATVLLLERCAPGTPLSAREEPEQDLVIAGLLPRLWLDPSDSWPFRHLEEMCLQWAEEFEERRIAGVPGDDEGLARAGIELLRSLPSTSPRRVLLCTDLHAGNVLAAEREAWLMIDPKPYVGDPHYDVLQHLLNCDERLRADPVRLTRRMAHLLQLDAERLLLWLFARCVQESPTWPALREVAEQIAPG